MKNVFQPAGVIKSVSVAPVSFWPTGRLWPNGNFSLGVTRQIEGVEGLLDDGPGELLPDWFLLPDAEGDPSGVALSNGSISRDESKRARKGLKGISSYGQQMLRSAAFMVERDYGKEDLCFATLTLPRLPTDARRKLQANWAILLNRFLEWVTRKLEAAGRPLKVFGCVEVQSERLSDSGEGYLHLHAIWPSHSNRGGRVWAVEADELRTWWKAAIERFAGVSLSYYPRVDTVPVKQSAEKYLGKYLSKGGGLIEEFIKAEGEESCPTAWWFMTAAMKRQITSETVTGQDLGVLLDSLIEGAFDSCSLAAFEWVRAVDVEIDGKKKTMGWCGRLTAEVADDLRRLVGYSDA